MNKTWTVADILKTTCDFFGRKGLTSPRLEAELLLSEVMSLSRVQLYVNFERILTAAEVDAYRELVRRRANHEPAAYILGRKEFYRLNFTVTKDTLIPRPETEHLVDEALKLAKKFPPDLPIADLGCGSGAISLSLARNLPQARIAAVDLSPEALAVAEKNALNLKVAGRVEFLLGDLAQPLSGRTFSLICANLPYVPTEDLPALPPDVALYEPKPALDGGPRGLGLYRRLLPEVPGLLEAGGYILMEIWPPSLDELNGLIVQAGLSPAGVLKDYGQQSRVVTAQKL
ncbi:MAG: peptide chain release factor N(5)-glutamine methyltransferase [Deltaproteobacteria bacterium]|jgi:release factor glutamine methyltransferase|nr:peptide chain release factor N(5)-glutamine methyltransferase [Deltaproteobacteria bacterium]